MHRLLRLFVAVGVVTGVASAVPRGVLTVEKSAANAVLLRAPPRPAEEAAGRRLEDPSAQHDVEPLGAAGRPTRQEHAAPLAHGGGSWRRMAEDDSDHLHMGPLNEQLQRYLHTDVEQWVVGKASQVVNLDGHRGRSLQSAALEEAALEEDGPWEPIRIHINTSSMYSDPTGRACYRWPHKRSHLIHHLARTDSRGLSVWVPG